MPELPEIVWRAAEIDAELRGKRIVEAHLLQEKCLNLAPEAFKEAVLGETFAGARYRGKWVVAELSDHTLLLNFGMGGEMLLHRDGESLPGKLQAWFGLDDGSRLSFHFWWFGYIHIVPTHRLSEHDTLARLGVDPLSAEFTPAALSVLLTGTRRRIKTVLLDQAAIAGIGNMYSHDILFRARLHPDRPANSLAPAEIEALWHGIRDTLQTAIDLGGSSHERNLHNEYGGFGMEHLLVGYKGEQPCPACGAEILKIKTGSNSAYICPACQPAP